MISNKDFVHTHSHSEFSRFDGLAKIDDFVLTAKLMGFPAIALTDHGNVGGWIKFWQSCKKKSYKISSLLDRKLLNNGVAHKISTDKHGKETDIDVSADLKPILGCEFYLARQHDLIGKENQPDGRKGNRHIILIAKNAEGYKNVCALSQRSWTHGQFHDPRVDLNLLAEHSKGVICTSACLGSIINNNLLHGQFDKAKAVATVLKDIFGDDFYLEGHFHGIDEEGLILPDILRLGKMLGIRVMAANDSHMCIKEQSRSQEVLMCMSQSRCIKDEKRMHFPYDEFYIKSAEEMAMIFGHHPEMMSNTVRLAESVEDFMKKGGMRLPVFDVDTSRNETNLHERGKKYLDQILSQDISGVKDVESSDAAFEKAYTFLLNLVEMGMERLKWTNSEPHKKALQVEMKDVRIAWESNRMDFATYFLIVWDYINFARSKGILTGCGRGSGYASLILRCLGICYGPDPLQYGLLWPRFLGFDEIFFLNDHDWGFGEAEEVVAVAEADTDDLLVERDVENDEGGVDRY